MLLVEICRDRREEPSIDLIFLRAICLSRIQRKSNKMKPSINLSPFIESASTSPSLSQFTFLTTFPTTFPFITFSSGVASTINLLRSSLRRAPSPSTPEQSQVSLLFMN
jgi:hypothetical protein